MTAGPRAGEFCQQDLIDNVRDHALAVRFNWTFVDYAYCNPFRTCLLCGKTRPNTGCENDVPSYYKQWRVGKKDVRVVAGDPQQWQGPFLQDLAMQYAVAHAESYDQTYLPTSHWPVVGTTNLGGSPVRVGTSPGPGVAVGNIGLGDSTDHLQYNTGGLLQYLPYAGVQKIGVFGKLANPYGDTTSSPFNTSALLNGAGQGALTDEYVPPGVTDCMIIVGDAGGGGDIQDHWHMAVVERTSTDGPNPASGVGVTGTRRVYRYNHDIATIAYVITSGGVHQLVITLTTGGSLAQHEFDKVEVGEEVAVIGCVGGHAAYNDNAWVISSIIGGYTDTYSDTYPSDTTIITVNQNIGGTTVQSRGNQGTWSSAGASACPRSLFCEFVLWKGTQAFYESCSDTDSFLCYVPNRMPHAEVNNTDTSGATTTSFEEELRYTSTYIPATDAYAFAGVYGSVGPAIAAADLPLNGAKTGIFQRRQSMMATFNDTAALELAYLDGRWGIYGHDYWKVSDNGWQQFSQNAAEPGGATGSRVGAKGYNYLDSQLLPFWARGPAWPSYGDNNMVVLAQDLAPTILDLFARKHTTDGGWIDGPFPILGNHHLHTTGDGESLFRKMSAQLTPLHPANTRAYMLLGQYHNAGGNTNDHSWAVLDQTLFKYIEAQVSAADHQLWDLNNITISTITWSAGVATVTCAVPHGRVTGNRVWISATPTTFNISGATQAGFNLLSQITVLDTTRFTVPIASNPGTFVSGILWSEWEMHDLSASNPTKLAALSAKMTAGKAGRFDPTTRINTCRTF